MIVTPHPASIDRNPKPMPTVATAIQSELVLRTNQSVAEHYNLIFPAVLMNNERFSINFTLKNYTNNEKTRKPNRMLTPNAGRKKLNNARR
jgi:hypothetical protein